VPTKRRQYTAFSYKNFLQRNLPKTQNALLIHLVALPCRPTPSNQKTSLSYLLIEVFLCWAFRPPGLMLAAGFYLLIVCISILSRCNELAMCGWRRASSFAIFGKRVGFVRIANVLDLVRGLATNFALLVFLIPLSIT